MKFILGCIVALAIAFAVAALLVWRASFSSETLARHAADWMTRATQRQTELKGVRFRWRGIHADRLSLSEPGNAKLVGSADDVVIDWRLLSIFRGRLDIRSLRVGRLSLRVGREMATFQGVKASFERLETSASRGVLEADAVVIPSYYEGKSLRLNWDMTKPPAAGTSGRFQFRQGPGVVHQLLKLLTAGHPDAAAIQKWEGPARQALGINVSNWTLDKVEADGTIGDGQMRLVRLDAPGPELGVTGQGTLRFSDGMLEMGLRLLAPPGSPAGDLNADLRITGTTRQPRVTLEGLQKRNVRASLGPLLQPKTR